MPYCTIDEAWNMSLNPELNRINAKNYKTNMDPPQIKKKQSRNYNRLPEHSGPKTRLPEDRQDVLIRTENGISVDDRVNHPSLNNLDLPINDYNMDMFQTLNEQRELLSKNKNKNIEGYVSKFTRIGLPEDNTSVEGHINKSDFHDIIQELRQENKRLKALVQDMKTSGNSDKDSLFDLLVFISTGVLILFMMENVTKLVKRF